MLDTFSMVKEISVREQRYQAVLAVIADGRGVGEVAAQFGVSRQSVHSWLRRYEDHGLERFATRSLFPSSPNRLAENAGYPPLYSFTAVSLETLWRRQVRR